MAARNILILFQYNINYDRNKFCSASTSFFLHKTSYDNLKNMYRVPYLQQVKLNRRHNYENRGHLPQVRRFMNNNPKSLGRQ